VEAAPVVPVELAAGAEVDGSAVDALADGVGRVVAVGAGVERLGDGEADLDEGDEVDGLAVGVALDLEGVGFGAEGVVAVRVGAAAEVWGVAAGRWRDGPAVGDAEAVEGLLTGGAGLVGEGAAVVGVHGLSEVIGSGIAGALGST
jgi:hypothetical protein